MTSACSAQAVYKREAPALAKWEACAQRLASFSVSKLLGCGLLAALSCVRHQQGMDEAEAVQRAAGRVWGYLAGIGVVPESLLRGTEAQYAHTEAAGLFDLPGPGSDRDDARLQASRPCRGLQSQRLLTGLWRCSCQLCAGCPARIGQRRVL